jgi:hypothetical protein
MSIHLIKNINYCFKLMVDLDKRDIFVIVNYYTIECVCQLLMLFCNAEGLDLGT